MLLTGLVIAADWIASSEDLFPIGPGSASPDRLDRAWSKLRLLAPWQAADDAAATSRQFQEAFDLPPGSTPNGVQLAAMDAARSMAEPGLLIIEAPMGEGKTEAAFAAAEVMAAKWRLGGAMMAMPTQATSDGIFRRFTQWTARVGADSGRSEPLSLYLAHGKAWQNEDFVSLPRADRITGIFDDELDDRTCRESVRPAVVAHEWLSGRKKGLLADFVVGTVDQVLFAALQSRHVVLRHLGLAGKVVIIDEVHAFDAYMNAYLGRALHWLAAYDVPVVMLSATLPDRTRKEFVTAYEAGRRRPAAPTAGVLGPYVRPRRRGAGPPDGPDLSYPKLTISSPKGVTMSCPAAASRGADVQLVRIDDGGDDLRAHLSEIREQGGCAGVICNTVGRAVRAYEMLRGDFAEHEILLVHSRFVMPDRLGMEARLRRLLGPDRVVEAAGEVRPERLVVVGTQVLEQSLDIDFDLLVTDLAPADLMLQRIGRLHRRRKPHVPRPAHAAVPRCLVRGVSDWGSAPPLIDGGSKAVYGHAPLLRAAAVLGEMLDGKALRLPDDVSRVVQEAYSGSPSVPDSWAEAVGDAEGKWAAAIEAKKRNAQTFLLPRAEDQADGTVIDLLSTNQGNANDGGAEEARGFARVRDSEESLEVLVAQRVGHDPTLLPWLEGHGGAVLPADSEPSSRLARELSRCTVRLPPELTKDWTIDATIETLEQQGIAAWKASRWLRGQLVLFLDEKLAADFVGGRLQYERTTGLHFIKDRKATP